MAEQQKVLQVAERHWNWKAYIMIETCSLDYMMKNKKRVMQLVGSWMRRNIVARRTPGMISLGDVLYISVLYSSLSLSPERINFVMTTL